MLNIAIIFHFRSHRVPHQVAKIRIRLVTRAAIMHHHRRRPRRQSIRKVVPKVFRKVSVT